ncbi:MAG: carbon monoxide dehydrogenase subunit G [Vicinamibacterales bacterium]|jgi:hypothetical protein|nr:carbon monoxide dehydrogenase [Acidobacteriota bacterium]MDP7471581.1 carbon monoxide dehydrogenase subunit G [Vicinamibacterales bacterium]MDP7672574.1 carbon monoxide dehydrogenase subunit G [Vicinamibacterales bacterium]HJO39380.1 carbon monoxide dehydrogenase subunit G [Vicinamibacterales bacterium]|tara:strand:- start:2681 stop:3124 length:444 start_codon:yes stop_codon:yes gene_type:complete
MELTASYRFDVPPTALWPLLVDPAVVASCLPGCEALEPVGDDSYRAVLTVGIAAVTGRYEGTVTLADQRPPHAYRLVVTGKGRAGFVNGEATLELHEDGGGTRLDVAGRAEVGGTIARVGQRLLSSASKMMMDRFFDCLRKQTAAPS